VTDKRTIARPYANAIFDQACAGSKKQAHAWEVIHHILAAAVETPACARLLKNPIIDNAQVIAWLVDVCNEVDADSVKDISKEAIKQWLEVLDANDRLLLLPEIAELYQQALMKHDGAVNITVTSAQALSAEQRKALDKQFADKWQKKITSQYQTDPSLVGGVRIQAGDWVMDSSLQEKLLRLSEEIQS
jgi:F-type H+-transporting ATPase subunit delta